MKKVLNILFIIVVLIFFFGTYKFYSSNKNLNTIKFNRNNIEQIINDKTYDLPILLNDTNNIIQFNDSFSSDIKLDKSRSFWNLLKSK
jgi:hypothetical protein